jgi:L-lactate dehydrogenase complex protein LldG
MVEKQETMSARDAILGRVRAALTGEPDSAAPTYELWPEGTWPAPDDLFARFADELQRVQGESKRCKTVEEARQFVQELRQGLGNPETICGVHPTCVQLVQGLAGISSVDDRMDRRELAAIPMAIMPASFLLADTGTVVVLPRNHAERLLCYLPEVSILIAGPGSIVPHLSDVWARLTQQATDTEVRGEMLLVTGPSRTADIEKKLVLGAHGPRRLIVMFIEEN